MTLQTTRYTQVLDAIVTFFSQYLLFLCVYSVGVALHLEEQLFALSKRHERTESHGTVVFVRSTVLLEVKGDRERAVFDGSSLGPVR